MADTSTTTMQWLPEQVQDKFYLLEAWKCCWICHQNALHIGKVNTVRLIWQHTKPEDRKVTLKSLFTKIKTTQSHH
jgi:hypothetical protein